MSTNVEKACIKTVVDASQGQLSEREAAALLRQNLDRVKYEASQGKQGLAETLHGEGKAISQEKLFEILNKQRQEIKNTLAEKKLTDFVNTNWGDDKAEGIVSYLAGSLENRKLARQNIDTEIKTLNGILLAKITQPLEQKKLWDLFISDKMEDEIMEGIEALSTPGSNIKDLPIPSEAKEIAKVLHEVNKEIFHRLNNAGANMRELKGFITNQTHNVNEVRNAAWKFNVLKPKTWKDWKPPTKEQNADAWINVISNHLNLEKTFPGLTRSEVYERLKEDWTEFATGNHLKAKGEEDYSGFTGTKNVAKQMAGHRSYVFKSARDFNAYNKQFGTGSLREAFFERINHSSRNIGLMNSLGSNPENMVNGLIKKLKDQATESGDLKTSDALTKKERVIRNILKNLDGSVNIPGSVSWAKNMRNVRNLNVLSMLGAVTPHSVADLQTIATRMKLQGVDYTKGYATLISRFMRGRGTDEMKRISSSVGLALNSLVGDMQSRWVSQGAGPGVMKNTMETFFKWNGLNRLDDSNQTAISWLLAEDMGHHSNKAFKELEGTPLGQSFDKYGITSKEWNLFRDTAWKSETGATVLTPDLIYEIPKEKIEKMLLDEGKNVTAKNVKSEYDRIHLLFTSYISDSANFAVPKPGARENASLNQGLQPGTVTGEAIRFVTQFMPFPFSVAKKGLGQVWKNGSTVDIGAYLAGTAILGYMGYAFTDILQGKKPRMGPKALLDGFIKGGGAGVYGDYVFGDFDKNKHPFASRLLGPTLSQATDVADVITRAKRSLTPGNEEPSDFGAQLARLAQRNTPGSNIPGIKLGLDYLIFSRLQETLNPGSVRRREEKDMEANEREYFFQLSDHVE